MSQFAVEVVRIGKATKNPNSDSLMMTDVLGHPVQFKEGSFQEGDLAAYVPVESMVPLDHPLFSFLKSPNHPARTHERIKARRLRGVFSMGFLVPAPADAVEQEDVAETLGVSKFEEVDDVQVERVPASAFARFVSKASWRARKLLGIKRAAKDFGFPVYDVESVRKYQHLLVEGEEVSLTEKIHGSNARFGWTGKWPFRKFHIGSRTMFRSEKDLSAKNYWTEIALKYDLKERLRPYPNIAIYGEVFGTGVQDLEYGAADKRHFRVFDVLDLQTGRWFDVQEMDDFVAKLGLLPVPTLYQGPWKGLDAHAPLAEGKTTTWCSPLENKFGIREGWVVRPVVERRDPRIGRVQFKFVGQGYLLRKNGTERH